MLSYRHAYHAGNTADVLKHLCLNYLIESLQQKSQGFRYIDTHAGAGVYDLSSSMPTQTEEWRLGVGRHIESSSAQNTASPYLVQAQTGAEALLYPGSPLIAARRLRPQDSAHFYELHSTDFHTLRTTLKPFKQAKCFNEDGLVGLIGNLPTPTRRALVLIDPSYEIKTDYTEIPKVIGKALKRMDNVVIALWIPVVDRTQSQRMIQTTLKGITQRTIILELGERADTQGYGMTSSIMLIINAPWDMRDRLEPVIAELAMQHSLDGAAHFQAKTLIER